MKSMVISIYLPPNAILHAMFVMQLFFISPLTSLVSMVIILIIAKYATEYITVFKVN